MIESWIDEQPERSIEKIQNVIRSIREIRNKYTIAPSQELAVSICAPEESISVLAAHTHLIRTLATVREISMGPDLHKPRTAAAGIVGEFQIFVHDVIDPQAERQRLKKQKEFIEKGIRPLQAKLNNEQFVIRARPEVVEQSRRKLAELTEQLDHVNELLRELQ